MLHDLFRSLVKVFSVFSVFCHVHLLFFRGVYASVIVSIFSFSFFFIHVM